MPAPGVLQNCTAQVPVDPQVVELPVAGVVASSMRCTRFVLVLTPNEEVPLNRAVMLCVPSVSAVVPSVALPPDTATFAPPAMSRPSARNVTVPLFPIEFPPEVTFAVSVMLDPVIAVLLDVWTVVCVAVPDVRVNVRHHLVIVPPSLRTIGNNCQVSFGS